METIVKPAKRKRTKEKSEDAQDPSIIAAKRKRFNDKGDNPLLKRHQNVESVAKNTENEENSKFSQVICCLLFFQFTFVIVRGFAGVKTLYAFLNMRLVLA